MTLFERQLSGLGSPAEATLAPLDDGCHLQPLHIQGPNYFGFAIGAACPSQQPRSG